MDSPNINTVSQQRNELTTTLETLQQRNAELKALLAYYRQENTAYKYRHKVLTEKLSNVNGWLEENVSNFFTLFEEAKNALHMGRSALQSAGVTDNVQSLEPGPSETTACHEKIHGEGTNLRELEESIVNTKERSEKSNEIQAKEITTQKDLHMGRSTLQSAAVADNAQSLKPGSSRRVTPYRKIHIEKINLKELERSIVNTEERLERSNDIQANEITTVTGESLSNRDPKIVPKEVVVRLSRLPRNIVEEHLKKDQTLSKDESSLDLTTSLITNEPEFTSTPLKLETMKRLGLIPTELISQHKFITMRKKSRSSGQSRDRMKREVENDSPLHKKIKIQDKETPTTSKKQPKKSRTPKVTQSGRSPKVRKAKPQQFKEPSLRLKMRREN